MILVGELTMIHRIFFDVGHEDFETSTDLLLKYPKAKQTHVNEDGKIVKDVELEDGKLLFKYM